MWLQKSRIQWLRQGERNTKCFHTTAVIRKARNKIQQLQDNDGNWITDDIMLQTMVKDHFQKLYLAEPCAHYERLDCSFPTLSHADSRLLNRPVSGWEVKAALDCMAPLKAPGPDGMSPIFWQHNWPVVGDAVTEFVLEAFKNRRFAEELNSTWIALIPKQNSPSNCHI